MQDAKEIAHEIERARERERVRLTERERERERETERETHIKSDNNAQRVNKRRSRRLENISVLNITYGAVFNPIFTL